MVEQYATPGENPDDPPKPSKRGIVLRWIGFSIGGLFAVVIILLAVFVSLSVPVELDWLKGKIEAGATEALGRKFVIEGSLTLVPSIPPSMQIEGVRLENPSDWPKGDLARLEHARVQLRILSLLKGEVVIEEVSVDGLRLNLDTDKSGNPNWLLAMTDEVPTDKSEKDSNTKVLKFIELAQLSLREISIHRRDAKTGKHFELVFDEIKGSALDREPMHLRIWGAVQQIPYDMELRAGSLADLVEGNDPWSLNMAANVGAVRLNIHGDIAEPLRFKGIALDFDLTVPNMKNLQALLGTRLPPIQSFQLRGHVQEQAGKYRFVDMEGEVAATNLTGSFEADLTHDRPIFNGKIDIPTIDAKPFLSALKGDGQDSTGDAAPTTDEPEAGSALPIAAETQEATANRQVDLDAPVLTLDLLSKLDARFNLTVHEVVNTPTSLRDANLEIRVENGALAAPLSVTFAEVPFKGELHLAPKNGQPKIALRLGTAQSDIGELARFLVGAEGIEGKFHMAELAFAASGESIRGLLESAELSFDISGAALSYGHKEEDGKAVGFTLDEARMSFPVAAESTITAVGSLLGEPFTLEANGGTFIENFVGRSWPLKLRASGGGARVDIDGIVRRPNVGRGSEIGFAVTGESIGNLASWIGVSPKATQSYELNGKFTRDEEGVRIQVDTARIGRSGFTGEVGVRTVDGSTPVTFAKLDITQLDLRGLHALIPESEEDREYEQGIEALTIDAPILPTGIELFDSEIEIAIARMKFEVLDITKVSFTSKIRDGYLEKAPIALTIAGSGFKGELAVDLRGEVPTVDLRARSSKVDVGALLSQLGVAKGIVLTAGDFELDVALEGVSMREVFTRSSFSAEISGGLWRIDDPNMEGSQDIQIRYAKIEAAPKRRIGLDIDGLIKQIPVKIRIMTDSLASFAEPKDRLKMDVGVELAKANLSLTGTAPMPVVLENLHFTMDLKGERLSDFDPLLDISLPPVGPYQLGGKFGTQPSGYYVKELQARVGNSSLMGNLDFNTRSQPPRLNLDLGAQSIQLDDFATRGWSATSDSENKAEMEMDPKKAGTGRALLSSEVLRDLNASVGIEVQSVQSGKDWLGSGKLTATLEHGQLEIDPLILDLPGGAVDLGFTLEPGERDVALEARANIENLDYGILARRIDPASETGGIISLDIDFKTRGPDFKHVMQGANGTIGFALAPNDLNAGIFDLWAVNLFTALMPSLDDDSKSKVNCFVARFGIDDGIMRPTSLLIDSSRIQASGDGVIDFKAETIDFKAKPRSKRPQMFSAKTPVQVRGKFSDFKVGLPPGALVGTVFRVITSPVAVPFQWVFTKKEPADGRVACRRAWYGNPSPKTMEMESRQNQEAAQVVEGKEIATPKKSRKPTPDRLEEMLQPDSEF